MSISDDTGALDYHRARETAAASGSPDAAALAYPLPPLRIAAAVAMALGLAAAIHLVGVHGEPATQLQLSLILGAAFGFVIQRSRFCFFCIWRDWLDRRDPRGLLGILTALAVGITGYTLVFGAWLPDPSGTRLPPTAHIGPVSLALVLAGLAFGAGMAISGSCISAHLYRLGEGSPTSPFALIGAVGGFILGFLSWNDLYLSTIAGSPVLWLPRQLGYGGSLLASLAILAALAWLLLRAGRTPPASPAATQEPLAAVFTRRWPAWIGGLFVGLIGVAAYLRLSPLGVTAEIGSRSRQLAVGFDWLPSRLEGLDSFRGCATVIRDALLTPNGLFIAGTVVAAFIAALVAGEFQPKRPSGGQVLRGLAGGVLLGWGTVIGLGCTVGTLLSGMSAGAVSGWVFAAALLAGTTVTLRLGRRLDWLP
ncbi:YeeE/YedE family protein [Bosea sp. (in: a-proteobacteria)]|uniref:YeeE/YedE family protein n=1 Tax=Bosea sp. (in: a-proteobacteria) TaxID=1871050 RepID=UPI000B1E50B4|nr:YeeE/YedE family protein [Bosea sp. (in: a-proteobacteria)]